MNKCKNCKHFFKLGLHPSNTTFKGSLTEHSNLYCCTLFSVMDENIRTLTILEDGEGSCEMFDKLKNN